MSMPLFSAQRRAFLARATITVGGVAAGLAPVSLLDAAPAACRVNVSVHADTCGDWTVDDICNAYPPYAFRTGAARPHTRPMAVQVDAVDRHWVV
jgi:hypothetical protein